MVVSFRREIEENQTKQKEWLLNLWLLVHWTRPKDLEQVKAFGIHDFLILLLLFFNIIIHSTDTENTTWPSQIMANNPGEQVMVTKRLKSVNIKCCDSVLKNKCILRNHVWLQKNEDQWLNNYVLVYHWIQVIQIITNILDDLHSQCDLWGPSFATSDRTVDRGTYNHIQPLSVSWITKYLSGSEKDVGGLFYKSRVRLNHISHASRQTLFLFSK